MINRGSGVDDQQEVHWIEDQQINIDGQQDHFDDHCKYMHVHDDSIYIPL